MINTLNVFHEIAISSMSHDFIHNGTLRQARHDNYNAELVYKRMYGSLVHGELGK